MHLGFVTGRIARPAKSRRFKFQQLLGHPPALGNTAPGFGGDGPESAIEALSQLATGAGFDGDGDASNLGSGPAGGFPAPQTTPGVSGDVPAFSSNVLPTSGTLGGAGWRSGALHIVILATDVCSISAFPAGGPIPGMITGTGASMEPVSAFACSSTTPGVSRFGFVSNSKTLAGNIVAGAVAPSESATVQATVTALNALGIRVLGMGPGATGPTASPGPSFSPSVLLSALARLTGAVDGGGTPLVFSIGAGGAALSAAIVAAILTTVTAPVDITLANSALPAGLSLSFTPSQVDDVVPGEMASFSLVLTGDGTPINGTFDLNFVDVNGETVLGTIPVTVECPTGNAAPVCTAAAAGPSQLWPPNHKLVPINISGVTDPDGDTVTIVATSVTQDEPLTGRGRGAGNTSPDASIDASGAVAVRSERNGNPRTPGDGRVYHISFTATDPSGAACSGIVDVCVPHDQGNGNFCVDGGPLFSSIP